MFDENSANFARNANYVCSTSKYLILHDNHDVIILYIASNLYTLLCRFPKYFLRKTGVKNNFEICLVCVHKQLHIYVYIHNILYKYLFENRDRVPCSISGTNDFIGAIPSPVLTISEGLSHFQYLRLQLGAIPFPVLTTSEGLSHFQYLRLQLGAIPFPVLTTSEGYPISSTCDFS